MGLLASWAMMGLKKKVETQNLNFHILGTKAAQDSQPICKTILQLEIE